MARHTFVTESHTFGDEKKTVEILSRSEIRAIVEDCFADMQGGIKEINDDKQRIWDILDQFKPRPPHGTKGSYEKTVREFRDAALTAAKNAAEAKEAVERLVETARETFRDVIAEMLEPHYRLLAQHLGIELPVAMAKPKAAAQKCPVSVRTTPPHAAGESPISEGNKKKEKVTGKRSRKNLAEFNEEIEFDTPKRRILLANAKSKQLKPGKNTTVSNRVKPQGIKPCRKK